VSPDSQTVSRGAVVWFSVSLTPTGGFTGPVALSVEGAPKGASATIDPSTFVMSSTTVATVPLRISTSRARPRVGTFILTVTAAGGRLTKSQSVQLTVEG
jgi:hypothetical protein